MLYELTFENGIKDINEIKRKLYKLSQRLK
jgi:hypothetical protein